MLHRPDCPVVANRDGLRRVPANAKGYKPCKICDPLGAPANV
jgi:methylphosphotriester-DNA--protein-cysteine methyltransferase